MHEVFVDHQDAKFDFKQNKVIERGNFATVERNIAKYSKKGITCLYLMGVHERDNYPCYNKSTNEIEFRKENCSPFAVTSRDTVNKMHGGEEAF